MKVKNRLLRKISITSTAIIVAAFAGINIVPAISSALSPKVVQGTTSSYVILAATTITNTGATTIGGTAGSNVGLSPGTSYTVTGSVTRSGTGTDEITTTAASIAQDDLVAAYNEISSLTPTQLAAADLAGQTITPGTYANVGGTFENSGTLTLNAQGDPNAVFIFQADSTVITSPNSTMVLTNGAQACNVYWRVGSSATIGVNSTFIGRIYALTSITANTGATIQGQLLARNGAVTLDSNTITNDLCTTAGTTTTTTPGSATTTPGQTGNGSELPSTGINSLIWIIGLIVIIGFGVGILRRSTK
jgi:hypothetical protein